MNKLYKRPNKFMTFLERFWFCVNKTDDECWEWNGTITNRGYGTITKNNKTIYAHRASWEIHFGDIPVGLDVLHKCDNRKCVNPNHLFLGTNMDNVQDKISKGRQLKGSQFSHSKLNEQKVKEIRDLYSTGKYSSRKLGEMFSVGHSAILSCMNGRTWKHV